MRQNRFPQTKAFIDAMKNEGMPDQAIDAFCDLYNQYCLGISGKFLWNEIEPPCSCDIVNHNELINEKNAKHGAKLLDQLVYIRLNGGLGTTMALEKPKAVIPVRDKKSFLEIAVDQILKLQKQYNVKTPLLLMNSFKTREDSLALLNGKYEQTQGLSLDFLQHKVPRIDRETNLPLALEDKTQNWAPPGHGDIYLALFLSGQLEHLVSKGFRWAFVSNIDNLAATIDPCLLGFLDSENIHFAMEVTDKTLADVKGGTLVRYKGQLMLLERIQVEDEHLQDFEDLKKFPVYNTNTLWWRLDIMLDRLKRGTLDLPMIVNPKKVQKKEVVQLETAMGAAIGCFERAIGLRVSRDRFSPVKLTADLLTVQSDACIIDNQGAIRPNPARDKTLGPPVIRLDEKFYKGLTQFEKRFPHPVSLIDCKSLVIEGDVHFGANIKVVGDVIIRNRSNKQQKITDGVVLTGEMIL